MFDTSETGRGLRALRPKAPALLRPFCTSFQQTPARGVQRASVSARRFGSTWTAPIVRYAHIRPPCSSFLAECAPIGRRARSRWSSRSGEGVRRLRTS